MSLKIEARNTTKLALPIIFGELAQMLLHIIDTAMIGATGPESYKQVAAAALALSVINIPFVLGIGITISVSQLVSMAKGKGDDKAISHYLYNGFWICAVSAVVISLGIEGGQNILFHLGQDEEVAKLALPFLRVMGLSIVPMLLFMTLKQFTDGLEYTRTAMVLSVLSLPINIFINWLLVFGNLGFPRMEMVGAAYGTLITRSLIFVVLAYVILTHRIYKPYISLRKEQWQLKWTSIKELLTIGIPSSLQIGLEAGVFAVSGIIVGSMGGGGKQLAAHQVALQCASFTFMVSMGLAQAGSIRVSNAFGQGKWSKISAIGKSTFLLALCYGVLCALLFVVFRHVLPIAFLHNQSEGNAEVIMIAANLLLLAGIFQIFDATQVISAGLLRGIKDVKFPTVLVFVAYWVLGLPVGYWLAKTFNLQASGIWWGFIIGLAFSSISLTKRFLNKLKSNATVS
ncbi:MATE family efflux transporter [Taibaiella sp. KBW10]|uniref:MATE family efflux transporter n=1 Tax=Taibaiella sp. KBW10 TaxID=2153357 RepID=UPI000F59F3BF|nr:MATE family efflux transporter [Taibaiella sp. KBW10]RQO32503.1 MATE family efflux transporter [Taibaiella sp. KBW10]